MTSSELIEIAWTQAWQLAALIAVVAVIVRVAAKRRPHLAHVLWLVVLAKCVTPPVMTSPGGIFCWLQAQRAPAAEHNDSSRVPAIGANVATGDSLASSPAWKTAHEIAPLSATHVQDQLHEEVSHGDAKTLAFTGDAWERITAPIRETSNRTTSSGFSVVLPSILTWCVALWLAGGLAALAIAALRVWSCLRSIGYGCVERRVDLEMLIARLSRRLKLRRRVRLIVTASRIGPAVVGLLRPAIILPAVVVEGKAPQELEPVLAHELIHVRRGDLWIGLWQVAVQALWWFHPLVWLANRLATRAAEACCDEEVIAELGCDPEQYARTLVGILEQKRGLVTIPAFPGMRPVDVTRERLERIMQLGQGCRSRTPLWCWLVLLAAAGVALPGAAFVANANQDVELQSTIQDRQSAAGQAQERISQTTSPANDADEMPKRHSEREQDQNGSKATDRDEPTVGQEARFSIALHSDAATRMVDQSLLADAEEIIIPAPPPPGVQQADRVVELRRNVRVWLQDGTIHARGERAALAARFQKGSGDFAELRIDLSGNARWTSGDLKLAANDLTFNLRPAFRGDASAPCPGVMRLAGGAQVSGRHFRAQAENIFVEFSNLHGVPPEQPARLLLEGVVTFVKLSESEGGGGGLRVQADRLEFVPRLDELKVDGKVHVEGKTQHSVLVGKVESAHTAIASAMRDVRNSSVKTSPDANELATKTYPVADLLIPVQHFHLAASKDGRSFTATQAASNSVFEGLKQISHIDARNEGSRPVPQEFQGKSVVSNLHVGSAPSVQVNFTALIELIQNCVAPDSWEERSGPGSLMPYRTTLSLVVRQTPAVHDKIADLLGQLRRLNDLSATLEVEAITIAGASSKAPFKLDNDPTESKAGVTYLTESECQVFRDRIGKSDAMTAAMIKVPRLTLNNGQGAELILRRPLLVKPVIASVQMPPLQFVPQIAGDRSAIRLQLAIGATKPLDALASNHEYAIKQGQSLLVDLTDELSWNHVGGPIGAQASAIRRQHKLAPAERVLLLITPQIIFEEEELLGVDRPAQ